MFAVFSHIGSMCWLFVALFLARISVLEFVSLQTLVGEVGMPLRIFVHGALPIADGHVASVHQRPKESDSVAPETGRHRSG